MMRQLCLNLTHHTDYSLEKFHIGACNRQAYQWLMQWPERYNHQFTMMYGPTGSGKTHLATIWQKRMSAFEITDDVIKNELPSEVSEKSQYFVLDNIDCTYDQTWLFHFYNLIKASGKFWFVTAQKPPKHIHFDLQDLKSRLMTFQVFPLELPDDDTCIAVLKKIFADNSLVLSDAMIQYMIKRIDRSYESLLYWGKTVEQWHRQHKRLTFSDMNMLIEGIDS